MLCGFDDVVMCNSNSGVQFYAFFMVNVLYILSLVHGFNMMAGVISLFKLKSPCLQLIYLLKLVLY